ncbi:MAG: sigma-54-dependent Fis family transcriptional regulator [Bacteroidales bacterium]|nr:sigma-54-dependent Fis family transcriptional regulator [Bacteroidales bacterium]
MKKTGKILVVDDNAGIRSALKILLPMHFAEVELIPSPNVLNARLVDFRPDVVLLDMNFHTEANTGNEGLFWLSEIKKMAPKVQVVLFTAYADVALAVEGMKRGAFDFVVKPWENEKLIEILKSAVEAGGKDAKAAKSAAPSEMIWGSSPAMKAIHATVDRIALTDASMLITGENGTGKDVLANEIHRLSPRRDGPMVSVDAGAIPETLFESELFGHVKGAFTDAHADKVGKFEAANGGTLFLDEIGNIPLSLQAKLLRVLQNRTVTRVGDTKAIPVDIRLICATNMNLEKMVAAGEFREDLFYRINTVEIKLPSLRERTDEIGPLAEMFIGRFAQKYHRSVSGISDEALALLKSCSWPGNIRELQNCLERAVIMSEKESIEAADLNINPSEIGGAKPAATAVTEADSALETLEAAEEKAIRAAMVRYNGNLSMVAKALDVSRPTLYSKLKKYGL